MSPNFNLPLYTRFKITVLHPRPHPLVIHLRNHPTPCRHRRWPPERRGRRSAPPPRCRPPSWRRREGKCCRRRSRPSVASAWGSSSYGPRGERWCTCRRRWRSSRSLWSWWQSSGNNLVWEVESGSTRGQKVRFTTNLSSLKISDILHLMLEGTRPSPRLDAANMLQTFCWLSYNDHWWIFLIIRFHKQTSLTFHSNYTCCLLENIWTKHPHLVTPTHKKSF